MARHVGSKTSEKLRAGPDGDATRRPFMGRVRSPNCAWARDGRLHTRQRRRTGTRPFARRMSEGANLGHACDHVGDVSGRRGTLGGPLVAVNARLMTAVCRCAPRSMYAYVRVTPRDRTRAQDHILLVRRLSPLASARSPPRSLRVDVVAWRAAKEALRDAACTAPARAPRPLAEGPAGHGASAP